MYCVIGVLAQQREDLEAKLGQVGDMMCFWFGGGCGCGHNGVEYTKGDGIILLDRWVLDAIGFKLMGDAPVQYSV